MTAKTSLIFALTCTYIFVSNCAPANADDMKVLDVKSLEVKAPEMKALEAMPLEVKAEDVIARCKTRLASQEAVLLAILGTQEYVVIAARNQKLDGKLVTLKHIIGKTNTERGFLYYLPGSDTPCLKLPYMEDHLSQDECFALSKYYAAKGLPTIGPVTINFVKCKRTATRKKSATKL